MEKIQITDIERFVIDMVKAKRLEKGLSQKQLAIELDVSLGFIGNAENPKYRAKYRLEHLNRLAKVFECSPKDFLPDQPL